MEMWFEWDPDLASGERSNTGFDVFNNINTTPGHRMMVHMHEAVFVLAFQFTVGNRIY